MDWTAEVTHVAQPTEPRHTEAGALFTALVLEVFRLNGALVMAGNRLCQGTDLTSARWQVLGAISLAQRPLTVAQIGRAMGLTRQSVQRIVDDLEAAGMVQRLAHPEHRRARLIQLTPLGETLYAEISRRQVPWANNTSEGLPQSELATALRVLQSLRTRLEDAATEVDA
jgi:DNA-binding MarR family transcriptional regulator